MPVLVLALIASALIAAAILTGLVLLRIATRRLDGSPAPMEKAVRRLLGVYVRKPDEIREAEKVRS